MPRQKGEIITFKVDSSLFETMKTIPNRSEFIRSAILAALDNVCPLCRGTGCLTPAQKEHWRQFEQDHAIRECEECHELRLVCERPPRRTTRPGRKPERGSDT